MVEPERFGVGDDVRIADQLPSKGESLIYGGRPGVVVDVSVFGDKVKGFKPYLVRFADQKTTVHQGAWFSADELVRRDDQA